MTTRLLACALAAPIALSAAPLAADVLFDNTLDGTGSTNPSAQSTFSLTNTYARGFAFRIDEGAGFNLTSLTLGLYYQTSTGASQVTGALTVQLFELNDSFESPTLLAGEQVSGLVVQAAGGFVDLDFQTLGDITLEGGRSYGLKIGSEVSSNGKIRGIQSVHGSDGVMTAGEGVSWGHYVRANNGEWYLNSFARLLGQLNGTSTVEQAVVPGPAAATTLLAGLCGLRRRRRR